MATQDDANPNLFTGEAAKTEDILQRFEEAWRGKTEPQIEDFLDDLEESLRQTVLIELIHTDLEIRIKTGKPIRIEEYLRRFPELLNSPQVIADLLSVECGSRGRDWREAVDELEQSFPDLHGTVQF